MALRWWITCLFGCLAGLGGGVSARGAHVEGDLVRKASWTQPTAEEVQRAFEQYLAAIGADAATRDKFEASWKEGGDTASSEPLLDRTIAALTAVEPRTAEVLAACREELIGAPRHFVWLHDESSAPEFVRANLRLMYGRWLAQHAHFDEALECLKGLTPQQVVDPAALLFYQAVSQHRLLHKEECLQSLARLMENESHLPRRYKSVAQLMEADIKPLEPDSLDEISRLMDDIRRRLDFGHAGKRVRQQEDDVIAKLDKMIEDLEQQQQQAQQSSGRGRGSNQPSNPAPDSGNYGTRGPGDVDQKNIGNKSGWGDLPPKQREEALQQISKDLPAHFRDVIEEYFRKLAREESRN